MKIKKQIRSAYLKIINSFGHVRGSSQSGNFGLGQFVLLIAIAPFIFDLHLYGFKSDESIPSLYEADLYRFESLPRYKDLGSEPTRPKIVKPLTRDEKKLLDRCNKSLNLHKTLATWKTAYILIKASCDPVINKNNKRIDYEKKLEIYQKEASAYRAAATEKKHIDKLYDKFGLDLSQKPELSEGSFIKEKSQTLINSLTSGIALDSWETTGTILWFIGLALIVPAIVFSINRRCWTLLLCGLCVPAYNYLVILFATFSGKDAINAYYLNSTLLSQVAFAWFIVRGKIRSKSFVMFIAVLSISVCTAVALGTSERNVYSANLPILVFIIAASTLRYIYLVIKDNFYLIRQKGWINNAAAFLQAAALWLPLGALGTGFYYISSVAIPNAFTNKLHEQGFLVHNSDHDFLDNALQSVGVHTDNVAYGWHLIIESLRIDIQKNADELKQKDLTRYASETFDKIIPPNLEFSPYESDAIPGVKQGVELAVDAAQQSTNTAYRKLTAKMKRALIDAVTEQEKSIKASIGKKEKQALNLVQKAYDKGVDDLLGINYDSQKSLWWFIWTFKTLKFLELLILSFFGAKSFLYVFARVRFHERSKLTISLGGSESIKPEAGFGISSCGLQYQVPADAGEHFYISRRFQCRGKAPRFAIPQPFATMLARLGNSSYSMNKVTMNSNGDPITCTATKGMEFFEWDLGKGEQVAFSFFNFVGMSKSIKLSTIISTRISNLLFGKMFYSVATGPGKLILVSEGRAEVSADETSSASLPPERIIACDVNAEFHVESEIDLVNTYLSSAYVKPLDTSKIIIDVDSLRGLKTGLGGFIRRFLLPI